MASSTRPNLLPRSPRGTSDTDQRFSEAVNLEMLKRKRSETHPNITTSLPTDRAMELAKGKSTKLYTPVTLVSNCLKKLKKLWQQHQNLLSHWDGTKARDRTLYPLIFILGTDLHWIWSSCPISLNIYQLQWLSFVSRYNYVHKIVVGLLTTPLW